MSEVGDVLKEGRDSFPPTLDQKELVGKVFTLEGYRNVKTKFGERHVATVRFDGGTEAVEAWLGGVLVNRQLKGLSDKELLPCRLRLTQDESMDGSPYVLEEVTSGIEPERSADISMLISLVRDWVHEIGGMGEVQRVFNAGTLMAPIAMALGYSAEGGLTWRLNSLDDRQKQGLIRALKGEWKPPEEEIPFESEPGDQIPFE